MMGLVSTFAIAKVHRVRSVW